MNILLSTASSFPAGEVPVLVSVTIGGVLVFVGLAIEKFADWMNDRYLGGTDKPHKSLETAGWCILMLGIFMEIAVAGWSANDAWQNKPDNQPIKAITAQVFLEIRGTNFDEGVLSRREPKTAAAFGFFNKDNWLTSLGCETFSSFPIRLPELSEPSDRRPNERVYLMSFNWSSFIDGNPIPPREDWVTGNNASVGQLEKK